MYYYQNLKPCIYHTSPFGKFFSFVFFLDFSLGLFFCLAGLLAGVVCLEAIIQNINLKRRQFLALGRKDELRKSPSFRSYTAISFSENRFRQSQANFTVHATNIWLPSLNCQLGKPRLHISIINEHKTSKM